MSIKGDMKDANYNLYTLDPIFENKFIYKIKRRRENSYMRLHIYIIKSPRISLPP